MTDVTGPMHHERHARPLHLEKACEAQHNAAGVGNEHPHGVSPRMLSFVRSF
jgi:hypothetical protein